MRVGVISDVHANLVALEAVLEDLPTVDALVCAGDVVGYNPWPRACVDRLRELEVATVMGNHDRKLVTGSNFVGNRMAAAGISHAREELDDDQLDWLGALPEGRTLFDGRLQVAHGHPDDPDRYTYPDEFGPELLDDAPALVLGHTHIQHHEAVDGGVVLNPGSVGQPRDGDPRAAYAVLDLEALTVDERRVPYDIEAVRARIEAIGLPERTGQRLVEGR
ncbi:MAG: metallophosphoesterase family protein [Halobacteriales archaeon]|nr:metallophosphoesterase family protein [Halobacteriales archaeon]